VPIVIGKSPKPWCFKNIKNYPPNTTQTFIHSTNKCTIIMKLSLVPYICFSPIVAIINVALLMSIVVIDYNRQQRNVLQRHTTEYGLQHNHRLNSFNINNAASYVIQKNRDCNIK
jgi:hypothetical protein